MTPSPLIFTYLDWRAFVRAWLAARPSRTRGRLAAALGCAPSFVTALLHTNPAKRRAVTEETLERLSGALDLNAEEADFFCLLVLFDRADEGSEARDRLFRRICADRRFREAHRFTVEQYELFSRWENVAILALAESRSFRADSAWLRDRLVPQVQLKEAQRALDLLLRLRLLTYDDDGRVRPAHQLVVAGAAQSQDAEALNAARRRAGFAMHRWMLERGRRALEEFNAEERYFSAGTQLVPEHRLPELQRMFQRWQSEWIDLCTRPDGPSPTKSGSPPGGRRARVYRLNLQFFPLSTVVDDTD